MLSATTTTTTDRGSSTANLGTFFSNNSRRRRSMIQQQNKKAAVLVVSKQQQQQSTSSSKKTIMMTARQMQIFNLLSGGVAGTVSSILTNPLEVMKTQLQASAAVVGPSKSQQTLQSVCDGIWKKDGVAGFWRGLAPTLVGIIPARSVYFYSYQSISTKIEEKSPVAAPAGSPTNALLSGLMAGVCSNTLTNPIWMIRTRMQLYGTPCVQSIQTLWNAEGVKGFYKGVSASYWGCTEGALQFVIYEQLKTRVTKWKRQQQQNDGTTTTNDDTNIELTKLEYFISAALSKGLASVLTYPHEVARTRLRELGSAAGGMWDCIFTIGKTEGTAGLYAGMGIHLAKVVPNSALMFLTYELVRKWLQTNVQVKEEVVVL